VVNPDLLIEYIVNRRKEPFPRVNFYEKPLVSRRDLAVLIVMDVSGSTGEQIDARKVIDLEKHAAVILGQGLAALGDRFALCGFSGNGREHCEYLIFKDLDDEWGAETQRRLMAAHPLSGTRIGAALRHSGYRLSRVEAKQRLILLITDGKPMDVGYDPGTRYAQFDVRMACAENMRRGIHTFGISTEENSLADMEIMFPNRRFVILSDIRKLPDVLPRMYLRMTA
jgi:nitric oxide reductase activation protein